MAAEPTEPEMLLRLMDGCKQAAGSAHQLAHAQQNPAFLMLRDSLEALRETAMKMATSKSVPRRTVLHMLDQRQASRN